MTPRTRYFLFGSVALLLVGLCTGLVAFYSGLPMGAFGQQDTPAELSYVPADAALVAYCNVQDVMHVAASPEAPAEHAEPRRGAGQFERETGINIERDIDRVVGFLVPYRTRRTATAAWSWPAAGSTWSGSKGSRGSTAAR